MIIRKIISRLFAKDNYLEYIGGVDVLPPPLSFEEEEKYLKKMQFGDEYAKKYIDEHPELPAPLITVNSWNEWTETSYLQPDDLYGYGYLEAITDVHLEELIKIASQPSVSAQNVGVEECCAMLMEMFTKIGMKAQILESPTKPAV